MPIIRVDGTVTQINVFTVDPGRQQPLIDYLARAAQVASEVPGWISASLHRSLDGTRVVNYAQSEDIDAARRVIEHLTNEGLIQGNKAFGNADPGLYQVKFTLDHDRR
ncbi:antibiotic biosynthesis monooxygenase family protein [Nocardia sp. NPDC101769]|uniref:antibiotic biosynthesis monooxygenase family protein n=1 Tax=Nocardia sp. NPDC101769 TaxID=3364333 RepID=UPI003804591E